MTQRVTTSQRKTKYAHAVERFSSLPHRKKGSPSRPIRAKPHETEMQIYRKIAAKFGRRGRGVKKTMSKAARLQRKEAGKISALKRGFYCSE